MNKNNPKWNLKGIPCLKTLTKCVYSVTIKCTLLMKKYSFFIWIQMCRFLYTSNLKINTWTVIFISVNNKEMEILSFSVNFLHRSYEGPTKMLWRPHVVCRLHFTWGQPWQFTCLCTSREKTKGQNCVWNSWLKS